MKNSKITSNYKPLSVLIQKLGRTWFVPGAVVWNEEVQKETTLSLPLAPAGCPGARDNDITVGKLLCEPAWFRTVLCQSVWPVIWSEEHLLYTRTSNRLSGSNGIHPTSNSSLSWTQSGYLFVRKCCVHSLAARRRGTGVTAYQMQMLKADVQERVRWSQQSETEDTGEEKRFTEGDNKTLVEYLPTILSKDSFRFSCAVSFTTCSWNTVQNDLSCVFTYLFIMFLYVNVLHSVLQ